MNKPPLTLLFFPDLLPWEQEGLQPLADCLSEAFEVRRVDLLTDRLVMRGAQNRGAFWLLAHHWEDALRWARRTPGTRVYISVLSQPPPASLFPALIFQKFKRLPSNVRFVAHSPLSFRFLCEIRRLPTDRVLYLPLPVSRPAARPAFTASEKPNVIVGTLARFTSESNLHYFLNIAHYVIHKQVNARFRVLGTGGLKSHLQTIVRDLGIQTNVTFDDGDSAALSELDILIYSPLQNTHFLPLLLAGSRGCAVLASELPGIEQLVTDGKDGFIVPMNDTKPMAELVLRLIADRNLRTAVGDRLKATLMEKYSAPTLGLEYAQRLVGAKSIIAQAA